MLNYKFRDATQDFDVILKTVSGVKDVIAKFADDNALPRDWMNSDFIKTPSYSKVLPEVSKHFRTLNNGTLEIRTVEGVYQKICSPGGVMFTPYMGLKEEEQLIF